MDDLTKALIDKMLDTDKELYEKILDTPVFAFAFNELVKRSIRLAQVQEKLNELLKKGIR